MPNARSKRPGQKELRDCQFRTVECQCKFAILISIDNTELTVDNRVIPLSGLAFVRHVAALFPLILAARFPIALIVRKV